MMSLLDNDSAAWCCSNLGTRSGLGDLPKPPADNRCELCGNIHKTKLCWDLDQELWPRHAVTLEDCFRGWVYRGCHSLLKWVYLIGRKKLFAYLDRCIPFGDDPPPPRMDAVNFAINGAAES